MRKSKTMPASAWKRISKRAKFRNKKLNSYVFKFIDDFTLKTHIKFLHFMLSITLGVMLKNQTTIYQNLSLLLQFCSLEKSYAFHLLSSKILSDQPNLLLSHHGQRYTTRFTVIFNSRNTLAIQQIGFCTLNPTYWILYNVH